MSTLRERAEKVLTGFGAVVCKAGEETPGAIIRELLATLDRRDPKICPFCKSYGSATPITEAILEPCEKHRVAPEVTAPGAPETCICAAIRLEDGEVWRGHRHDNCIHVAVNIGVSREQIAEAEQGFITSRHRFVSREEGCELQRAAGIPSATTKQPLTPGMLFSEDLYLRETKGMPLPSVPLPGAGARTTTDGWQDISRARERLRFQPPPGPPDPPPSHATVTTCPNGHPLFWVTNRHAVCDADRTDFCVAWELRVTPSDGRRRLTEVLEPSARAYAYSLQQALRTLGEPPQPQPPRDEP